MNETLKTLHERRSIRAYRSEPLSEEHLDAILQAGLMAPSAKNQQSSVMVAVRDPETVDLLRGLNAQLLGLNKDVYYGARTVVVVLADPTVSTELNAVYEGSLVLGNLMNAAWSLGVGSCWINRAREIFDMPVGKELLRKWGLPEHLIGVGHCILGYPADGGLDLPRKPGRIIRA